MHACGHCVTCGHQGCGEAPYHCRLARCGCAGVPAQAPPAGMLQPCFSATCKTAPRPPRPPVAPRVGSLPVLGKRQWQAAQDTDYPLANTAGNARPLSHKPPYTPCSQTSPQTSQNMHPCPPTTPPDCSPLQGMLQCSTQAAGTAAGTQHPGHALSAGPGHAARRQQAPQQARSIQGAAGSRLLQDVRGTGQAGASPPASLMPVPDALSARCRRARHA